MKGLAQAIVPGMVLAVAFALSACGGSGGDKSHAPATETPGQSQTAPLSATPHRTSTPRPTRLPPAPGEDSQGDQLMYLALGDSLSEGVSASDEKRTAWVPLVAIGLGPAYELRNLGIAGLDSRELIEDGPLDRAQQEVRSRAIDAVPGNEVAAITLEIGGNDLLDLYFDLVLTGLCPSVTEALDRPVCVNELRNALNTFGPNLDEILSTLQDAAPGVPIFLMTLYNPFSGGSSILDETGVLALEGREGTPFPEGLNDVIRARAASHPGVLLVEWYDLFLEKQGEYISQDLIHPNDEGYAVMADAVLAAMRQAGLP